MVTNRLRNLFFSKPGIIFFSLLFIIDNSRAALNAAKQNKPLLQLECLVTIDGVPSPGRVEIHSVLKNRGIIYNSPTDSLNNVCRASLESGDDYEIVVRVEKFPQQVIGIKATHLDSTIYMNVFADFMSPPYDKKLQELKQTVMMQQNGGKEKKTDLSAFTRNYGNFKKDELYFTVQVGAFKLVENFNYNNVAGLPKIIRQTDENSVTRFTMGHYATYNEALNLLQEVKKRKIKEAFILAYYKGQRKSLNQLLAEKLIP
jgi:hypothetical protein